MTTTAAAQDTTGAASSSSAAASATTVTMSSAQSASSAATAASGPASAANSGSAANVDREQIYTWILELSSPDTRETALLELRYALAICCMLALLLVFESLIRGVASVEKFK